MEANMGRDMHPFYAAESSKRVENRSQEWDLNEWKWDGELFMAVPVNPGPLECRNKQLFSDVVLSNGSSNGLDEFNFRMVGNGVVESEKRRRVVVVGDDKQCDDAGSLTLKLGGHAYPEMEEDVDIGGKRNGKRCMVQSSNINQPKCQVEGCTADLSQSKDYHRRHKVCEAHAKANNAVVGNVIQRFCQQCSRFHLLDEFDEGKRSCRRRLAGHNIRRRKTHSDVSASGTSTADDQSTSYLLISLLKILANLTSGKSQQSKDNELLSNLLKNIASLGSSSDGNNNSSLQASQDLPKVWPSATSGETADALISQAITANKNSNPICALSMPSNNCNGSVAGSSREWHCQQIETAKLPYPARSIPEENGLPTKLETQRSVQHMLPAACTVEVARKMGFDLNAAYIEQQDGSLGCDRPVNLATLGSGSSNFPPWMVKHSRQLSPPQISGYTDSASTLSPSSSNGDVQSRTDRIVFKLFGKDPNDFPLILRAQILDWLSHCPTDMEGYIRPGCIILSVYLRLGISTWDELCHDLGASMNRLLHLSTDDFWRKGWIYARLQNHIVLINNGRVVLNKSLILERTSCSKIFAVSPIAATPSSRVTFKVKGSNLIRSTTRLLCGFEGRYLIQDIDEPSLESSNDERSREQFQSLSFTCYLSDAIGRGFIEVEDTGLSCGFFPFVVAEEDLCTEIRMLESSMDVASYDEHLDEKLADSRSSCVDFLHEIGWLLRRSQLKSKPESGNHCLEAFSFIRFRWILRFSIDHDWPAIVERLLDILFNGIVDLGMLSPTKTALSENLLHYAVQSNSKLVVRLLLRYKPHSNSDSGA
ncbi:Squamosa promoter-binding-like protein 1 [Platanthera guangdongensis]|uniref:Squamosa promoter-binding-like protein 1 n=1 Tax=Platanthera guangdongensis TaxID=2320717 RepID=A0ABR2LRA1_9ASPA